MAKQMVKANIEVKVKQSLNEDTKDDNNVLFKVQDKSRAKQAVKEKFIPAAANTASTLADLFKSAQAISQKVAVAS
jgi:hypothetical protein